MRQSAKIERDSVYTEMSPFPAWLWEVKERASHRTIKRFKTDDALRQWFRSHTRFTQRTRRRYESTGSAT